MNMRLPRGVLIQGGVNTGRSVTNNCEVVAKVDNPSTRFCEVTPKFLTSVKFQGAYPLPWNSQFSAVFQNLPGPEITAAWDAPNDASKATLGRDLAAGATNTSLVALMEPGQTYDKRTWWLDFRFTKTLRLGRMNVQGIADLYNVMNTSGVLSEIVSYGTKWRQPDLIQLARFVKFGAKIDF